MSAYTPRASLSVGGYRGFAAILLTDTAAQLCAAFFDRPGYPAPRCTFRPAFTGTDQPSAALVNDLKARGLLDDTLVVWGGEFGRTVYSRGKLTAENYGRDHHPRCFTVWMAGAGVKAGSVYGETDDYSYNIVRDPVHIHDLNATTLHLLGVDHTKLTYRFAGRDYRLTDVHGHVVKGILS
jgi:hypothetical protein